MTDIVTAWAAQVSIPTYKIGLPDKNPMFLEKRVYQGSSGAVYPHAVIDRVFDEKEDKTYTGLFLENRYLKIMILPEIGGRVQMALDKTNGYHFVYYNQVIKPALVGLTGPWISGGIEFNWPQHHRPSTFDPLDWKIEAHADGSQTVWCTEIEKMFHTRGMHGFTLYPDRAYLEINVQLYNHTDAPQTFLWWANPAVSVNDDYQSVFPPDVHAVMDHGKRDVSAFPIATGTYYKKNYAPGTDISRYKNIPVPTSYMAYHSDFDFVGDYDDQARAGMLHIANHHVVPGKKQWTWGNGDFGQAWDRQLTDEDGPYIELMCGAYTDNQPDFSWLQPGEEKSFTQVFMPYQQIGPACNANEQAVLHLDVSADVAHCGVYVSAPRQAEIRLLAHGALIHTYAANLEPATPWIDKIHLPEATLAHQVTLQVWSAGTLLLEYTPLPPAQPEIPNPATPARDPQEIESIEELFLNGLHLEQYRHATYTPEPYYQEGLRRDPGDSSCNNALGLLLYRRGKFAEAEQHFQTAIRRLTQRNPNPYDGEAYYNLGLSLRMQERYSEAFNAFHKAVWNAAWQDAAYFELARLFTRRGNMKQALDYLQRSLNRNQRHYQARHLQIALLRRSGEAAAARTAIQACLALDPMNYGALWEQSLIDGGSDFSELARYGSESRMALALDYLHAGLWDECLQILEQLAQTQPLAAYTRAWALAQSGRTEEALRAYEQAATFAPDFCFPNRIEDVLILQAALRVNPQDGNAHYFLGNFWYGHRRYTEAIQAWEAARTLKPDYPTVWRNLGLAYYNKRGDSKAALACFEKAFQLDPTDARVLFELDQLRKSLNFSPQARLEELERYPHLVEQRDDLTVEKISLLNLLDRPAEAYRQLMARIFHPWEGGEGKVTGQYVYSLVEMARNKITTGEASEAAELLFKAQKYPHNLGEGKLAGAQENNIFYWLGCAGVELQQPDEAVHWFEQATQGLSEPASAMYYNDQPPDMIFYQGLAQRSLGRTQQANAIFEKLKAYGQTHLDDVIKMDYFAVSLPDFLVFDVDLNQRNRIHCAYMLGLGALGLQQFEEACAWFSQILEMNAAHQGAHLHLQIAREWMSENGHA